MRITASEEIFKALKPETETSISYAKIYLFSDGFELILKAGSLSDLRAAANSWLRLIKMCTEIEEVLKNE